MNNELPLCPVAGWTIQTIPAYEAITIQLDFLTNALQKMEEANHSPTFVLPAAQAMELAQKIQVALQKLQSAGFQPPPGPRQ